MRLRMQSFHQAFSFHRCALVECTCFLPPIEMHRRGSYPIRCADSPTNPPAWPIFFFQREGDKIRDSFAIRARKEGCARQKYSLIGQCATASFGDEQLTNVLMKKSGPPCPPAQPTIPLVMIGPWQPQFGSCSGHCNLDTWSLSGHGPNSTLVGKYASPMVPWSSKFVSAR
jgi:hypothetical protein